MGAGLRAAPDLSAWPGAEVLGALDGGARAVVHLARRGDRLLVAKASTRSAPSLDWELDLLAALHDAGLAVPTAVPTADGRRHDGGVFLQPFLTGGPPRDQRDWRAVAAVVATAHEVTRGWPQRPGSAGAAQLLRTDRGGDVDLSAVPPEVAGLVRACWRARLRPPLPPAAAALPRDRLTQRRPWRLRRICCATGLQPADPPDSTRRRRIRA